MVTLLIFAISCSKEKSNPAASANSAPDAPQLDSASGAPGYQSSGRALVDTLYWTCTDPDGDALTYDVYFGSDAAPALVSEGQSGTSYITDSLEAYTTYHWRIMAKDGHGHQTLSWSWSFTTVAGVPQVTTASADSVSYRRAWVGGEVVTGRGSFVTGRGVCWSTAANPTIADSLVWVAGSYGSYIGSFDCVLTHLPPDSRIYYRAFVTSSLGIGYGGLDSVMTLDVFGTVTDIDGNVYRTVNIFGKWWMAENLVVAHFRNGDSIPYVSADSVWTSLSTDAFCFYANSPAHAAIFGALYNWYAVSDNRNIAPEGWHVATVADWEELRDSLGGSSVAGGKLKKTGGQYWYVPNIGATDEYGFSALGAGYRTFEGYSLSQGYIEYFWTPHPAGNNTSATQWNVTNSSGNLLRNELPMRCGFSVRCVKD